MAEQDSTIVKAAKAAGKAAGKIAAMAAVTPEPIAAKPVPANLYQAKYVGSGTFLISKPKKNGRKTHQQRVKNDRRGRI